MANLLKEICFVTPTPLIQQKAARNTRHPTPDDGRWMLRRAHDLQLLRPSGGVASSSPHVAKAHGPHEAEHRSSKITSPHPQRLIAAEPRVEISSEDLARGRADAQRAAATNKRAPREARRQILFHGPQRRSQHAQPCDLVHLACGCPGSKIRRRERGPRRSGVLLRRRRLARHDQGRSVARGLVEQPAALLYRRDVGVLCRLRRRAGGRRSHGRSRTPHVTEDPLHAQPTSICFSLGPAEARWRTRSCCQRPISTRCWGAPILQHRLSAAASLAALFCGERKPHAADAPRERKPNARAGRRRATVNASPLPRASLALGRQLA